MHYVDISLKLSGEGRIADEQDNLAARGLVSRTANAPAPLPVIGLRASWAVSPHWLVGASGQYFRMSSGSYSGYLGDLRPAAPGLLGSSVVCAGRVLTVAL